MFRCKKGFTLAEIMVAAGLLGVLSLAFLQLTKNIGDVQSSSTAKADEMELETSIRLLLNDDRHCRVSLAGNGPIGSPDNPVTFYKQDIDEEQSEGLDVALYLSNQSGDLRLTKKFNGANFPEDSDQSKYGKLTIDSISLIMNNGNGFNYDESTSHQDIGLIRVIIDKKIASDKSRKIPIDFSVNIRMATNNSGLSTILSCSSDPSSSQGNPLEFFSGRFTGTSPLVVPTGFDKENCQLIVYTEDSRPANYRYTDTGKTSGYSSRIDGPITSYWKDSSANSWELRCHKLQHSMNNLTFSWRESACRYTLICQK